MPPALDGEKVKPSREIPFELERNRDRAVHGRRQPPFVPQPRRETVPLDRGVHAHPGLVRRGRRLDELHQTRLFQHELRAQGLVPPHERSERVDHAVGIKRFVCDEKRRVLVVGDPRWIHRVLEEELPLDRGRGGRRGERRVGLPLIARYFVLIDRVVGQARREVTQPLGPEDLPDADRDAEFARNGRRETERGDRVPPEVKEAIIRIGPHPMKDLFDQRREPGPSPARVFG